MDIPERCRAWAEAMRQGEEESRILANLEADECLPPEAVEEFFSRLAAVREPESSRDARESACQILKNKPDVFACTGKEVPSEHFAILFRMDRIGNLRFRHPNGLQGVGQNLEKIYNRRKLKERALRRVTDDYKGEIALGDRLGNVWVADGNDVDSLRGNLSLLADRLGLRGYQNEQWCVACLYARAEAGESLHVPRALDGLDSPDFRVMEDCGADTGKTHPITQRADEGLPEAVHRSCTVTPIEWSLQRIS